MSNDDGIKTAPRSEIQPMIELYFTGDKLTADDMLLFLDYIDAKYRELGGAGLKIVEAQTLVPEQPEP